MDPRDEKIANLEAQLAEAQTRERDGILRVKAEWKTCVDVLNWILKKPTNSRWRGIRRRIVPVMRSLDHALEVADKANPDMSAIVEDELTLKSMLMYA